MVSDVIMFHGISLENRYSTATAISSIHMEQPNPELPELPERLLMHLAEARQLLGCPLSPRKTPPNTMGLLSSMLAILPVVNWTADFLSHLQG